MPSLCKRLTCSSLIPSLLSQSPLAMGRHCENRKKLIMFVRSNIYIYFRVFKDLDFTAQIPKKHCAVWFCQPHCRVVCSARFAPRGALLRTRRVAPSSGLLEQLCQYWPNNTKLSPCFHSDISAYMSNFGLFPVTLKNTKQKGKEM